MPRISQTDITADSLLTEMAVSFEQDAEGFLFNKVFTTLPVEEQTGHYYVWDMGDQFRVDTQRRAPGTAAAIKEWGISQRSYVCEPFSLKAKLPKEHKSTKDSPVDDEAMVQGIVNDMMMKRELMFHAAYMVPGVWGTDLDGATADFVQWNAVGATILANVLNWQTLLKLQCGLRPNVGVMSWDVFAYLKTNAEILDRIKYTSSDSIAIDIIRRYFELDELYVGDAIYNAGKEGAADAIQAMATGVFAMFHVDARTSKRIRTAGRVISWTEFDEVRDLLAEGGGTTAISSWWDDSLKSDWYQGDAYFGMHVVSSACGLLADNVLA